MIDKRTFRLPGRAVALVLAGGRGSRLYELTDWRAKPAVYFGGEYRIVDFALSNCVNSGIRRIGVVTQYKSHSLLRHLQRGWSFLRAEINEFVDLLPAQQRVDEESWYRGTADAVYQNLDIVETYLPTPEYVVILAGDHIYRMNYAAMLVDHVEGGAECTIACIEVPRKDATGFGVMAIDDQWKITDFVEKPADPPPMPGKPDASLCSMGIYIFNAKYLYSELRRDIEDPESSHDFGKDIIPHAVKNGRAKAHPFHLSCVHAPEEGPGKEHYWRDVGTLDSFWQSNIDLVSENPQLDIYDQSWPIRGNPVQSYPSKFFYKNANIKPVDNSLIGGGCVITDASISYSVLFDRIRINEGSSIDHSVVLPEVVIGKNCILRHCIIDRHCVIPDGMHIGVDKESDRKRFRVSSSGKVVLVTPAMLKRLEGGNVPEEGHLD